MREDSARMDISPAACRAARAALNWALDDLALHAGLDRNTIWAFENGIRPPYKRTRAHIRRALQEAGCNFSYDGQVERLEWKKQSD